MLAILTHHRAHAETPCCPVRHVKAELMRLPVKELCRVLPAYLKWKASIKVQPIHGAFLCSYYDDWNHWDMWVSFYDPRKL